MPIYSYHCAACQHEFESIHSMQVLKDGPSPECPKCKTREVNRVPSLIAGHVWKCNPDGAAPRKAANHELDRKAAKKERVDAMVKRQLGD